MRIQRFSSPSLQGILLSKHPLCHTDSTEILLRHLSPSSSHQLVLNRGSPTPPTPQLCFLNHHMKKLLFLQRCS